MAITPKKIKQTKYFVGINHSIQDVESAINSVVEKREEFIEQNKHLIAKIENEELILKSWNNGTYIIPIIKLTYYTL